MKTSHASGSSTKTNWESNNQVVSGRLSPRSHCPLNRGGRHLSALPPTLTQSPMKADCCWPVTLPSLGPWTAHALFPFHTHIRLGHPLGQLPAVVSQLAFPIH